MTNEQKQPEVGDVWKAINGDLIYIIEIGKNFIDFLGFSEDDGNYFKNFFYNEERFTLFTKYHKYLGKSKANIEQLFEVQDE